MNAVTLTHELQGYIKPFTGKGLPDAIQKAEAWAKENNFTLNNYYAQASERAILVGYSTQKETETG